MRTKLNISTLAGNISELDFTDVEFDGRRLSRLFGRASYLSNCNFNHCIFPQGAFFQNVNFDNCRFKGCTFGSAEGSVFFSTLSVTNCEFLDCDLNLDDAGTRESASRIIDSKIVGGKIGRFFFKGAEFSGATISSELRKFVLYDCFGEQLFLIGSKGFDASVHDLGMFTEVKFPEDSEQSLWRDSKVLYSDNIFRRVLSCVDDPESWESAAEQALEDASSEFISYSIALLEQVLCLRRKEDVQEIFEMIRCQSR